MKKIVVKVGTSTLTQGTQKLSRRFMLGLVQQIAHLEKQGLQIILVSSGAVAAGRDLLNTSASNQTLASIGQVRLMHVWAELFSLFDLQVGQVLLTMSDFAVEKRDVTRETLNSLLLNRIIPIVNENDAVATREIRVGNNDKLAALTAGLVGADTVVLLTDQEGLFTADPRLDREAKLIPRVKQIDETIWALAGGSLTSLGTGGMAAKVEAAQMAAKWGAETRIAPSSRPHVLIDLAEGKEIGTLFLKEDRHDSAW